MKKILTILAAVFALSTAAHARELTDAERISCLSIGRGGSGPGSRQDCFKGFERKAGLPAEITGVWCSPQEINKNKIMYLRNEVDAPKPGTLCDKDGEKRFEIQVNGDVGGLGYECKSLGFTVVGKETVLPGYTSTVYRLNVRCGSEDGHRWNYQAKVYLDRGDNLIVIPIRRQ